MYIYKESINTTMLYLFFFIFLCAGGVIAEECPGDDFFIRLGDGCDTPTYYDSDGDVCAFTCNEYEADECYITWGDGNSSNVDPNAYGVKTHHSYTDGFYTATFECKRYGSAQIWGQAENIDKISKG